MCIKGQKGSVFSLSSLLSITTNELYFSSNSGGKLSLRHHDFTCHPYTRIVHKWVLESKLILDTLWILNTSIAGCHINKRIRSFVLFSLYYNYTRTSSTLTMSLPLPLSPTDSTSSASFEKQTKTTCQNNPPLKIVIISTSLSQKVFSGTWVLTSFVEKNILRFFSIPSIKLSNCNLTFPALTGVCNWYFPLVSKHKPLHN